MEYGLLADGKCCRDETSLVLVLTKVGYLSSGSAAPARLSVPGLTLYEATGAAAAAFIYPLILVPYLGCYVGSSQIAWYFLLNCISSKDTKKIIQLKILVKLLKQVKFG